MTTGIRPHLAALTGIRFIAAMWVVLHHATKTNGYFSSGPQWALNLILNAYLILDLFFIMSGFVLAYTYLDPRREAPIDRRSFWIARLARLYPVYLFALLVAFLAFAGFFPPSYWGLYSLAGVGSYLLMIQAWLPSTIAVDLPQFPNQPSWAVSAEFFFYLVFPFFAAWIKPASRKRLLLTLVLLFVVSTAARGLVSLAPQGGRNLPLSPLWLLPEFLMGVCLGRIFVQEQARPEPEGGRRIPFNALSLGAVLGSLSLMAFSNSFVLIIGLGVPLVVLLVYCLARGEGRLASALSHPVLVLLGESSYAIYILHAPVGLMAARFLPRVSFLPTSSAAFYFTYIAGLIGLSLLVTRYLEIPARDFIRGHLFRPRRSLVSSPGRL